ncbi:MAG: hypothetical protein OXH52_15715 [Gammaproteobacteria bacterium]|nr:hypothetical protein [Gammaproteobacteria bacterium]
MNLDPNPSGKASDVRIDPAFGEWVLRTIRDGLRPRFVICLGLKGKSDAIKLLERVFDDFHAAKPHADYPLECYEKKRLRFREWNCVGSTGNQIKLVMWPQHPSQPPFSSLETWRGACREFAGRHCGLIRP